MAASSATADIVKADWLTPKEDRHAGANDETAFANNTKAEIALTKYIVEF